MTERWQLRKLYDESAKQYIIHAKYTLDLSTRQQFQREGLMPQKLYFEQKGGLPFGVIGSLADVAAYWVTDAVLKQLASKSITVGELVNGWTFSTGKLVECIAAEAAAIQAGRTLDDLVVFWMSLPTVALPAAEVQQRGDRTVVYRGKLIEYKRDIKSIFKMEEWYEYRGRRFEISELPAICSTIDGDVIEAALLSASPPD